MEEGSSLLQTSLRNMWAIGSMMCAMAKEFSLTHLAFTMANGQMTWQVNPHTHTHIQTQSLICWFCFVFLLPLFVTKQIHVQRNGQGIFTYANGMVWTGGWKDDKRHGEGVLKLPDSKKAECPLIKQAYDNGTSPPLFFLFFVRACHTTHTHTTHTHTAGQTLFVTNCRFFFFVCLFF